MKKQFVLILLCMALLCLTACGAPAMQTTTAQDAATEKTALPETTAAEPGETAAEPETETEAPAEPETFVAATVSVRFADGSLPPEGQYDTFDAESGEMQTQIVLSTDAVVRDFKVLSLTDGDVGDDGKMHFTVKELKSYDRLTPDRPLVVKTVFYGLIPNNGISYVDETGATRTFAVDMSGEDGSLYLWEFD